MAIGKIDEKYFLSPREAIELVGPETYGDDWRQALPVDDPLMKGALHNLYAALQSGRVLAVHHRGDGNETPLLPIEAAHEFFRIDLSKDVCFPRGYDTPFALKIDRTQLVAYLKMRRPIAGRTSIGLESRCTRWMIERIRTESPPRPKKDHFEEAKKLFHGIGANALKRARDAAIKATGRDDLRRGGPRRRGKRNQTGAPA